MEQAPTTLSLWLEEKILHSSAVNAFWWFPLLKKSQCQRITCIAGHSVSLSSTNFNSFVHHLCNHWTGKLHNICVDLGNYIHNHGALNNSLEGNCAAAEWQSNMEHRTYATHLKKAGYKTGYVGKYLNQYGLKKSPGGPAHIPPGWDHWFGLVGNSKYYNYNVSNNGVSEHHGGDYATDYFTDLIKNNSVQFLKQTMKESPSSPFLLVAATPAPHGPFTPAPQYSHVYDGKLAPRTPNWNHHSEDKHWLVRTTSVMDSRVRGTVKFFKFCWHRKLCILGQYTICLCNTSLNTREYFPVL